MRKLYLMLLAGCFAAMANGQNVAVTGADAATNAASPFATLSAAFVSINATAQTGNTIAITIIGNTTEPTVVAAPSAVLNAGTWTSISIQPSGGAARTISGAATAGFPLIDFPGPDNVTINGLNTGGNSLTIENTTASATSNTSTIRFTTDATSNTITNCSILGSSTSALGALSGNIIFGSSAVSTGCDNNTISNCDLGPAGVNLPTKLITFTGSSNTNPGTANSGITLNNNNFFDWFSATAANAAIDVNSGTVNLTVSNNRFYQTATRTITTTTSVVHSGVRISNSSGFGYDITGNIFGYASKTQTGLYSIIFPASTSDAVVPVILSVSATASPLPASIQNNTIAGFSMSGGASGTSSSAPFRGIYISGGVVNVGDITGNTIGSQSSTGSITYTSSSVSASDVMGIFNFGTSSWMVSNNTIGGITAANSSSGAANVYGIRLNTFSTAITTISGNTVGGTVANSIQSTSTAAGTQVVGVFVSTSVTTVSNSTIRNLTAAGGTGVTTTASVIGINFISSTPVNNASQNTIFNLSNTNATASTAVTGIQYIGANGGVVDRNLIYGLSSSTNNVSAEVTGIRIGSGGAVVFRNNMIAIGAGTANAIGAAATNASATGIIGINETGGTNSIFHNSVYIGGSPTAGTGASYAFNGVVTSTTRSFRDNIFFNARNNSGATGKNYAVKINGTTPNPTGLTINNNVYYGTGTGFVFGFFNSLDVANLAAWKTAVGQDAGSFEGNPQYNDPSNATPDLHLHPTNVTVAEGNGVDVGVTNDYDGQTRASFTPVDIGADAGNFMGVDLAGPSITYTNLANTTSTANRTTSSFATITDPSLVNITPGTAPRIYYKKSTDVNNIFNDNTSATVGWKYAESPTGSSPFDFTLDYSLLNNGPVVVGDVIQYFVIAQDQATTPNVGINSGSFAATPASVNLTAAAFPIGGTPNSYTIVPSISGIKNIPGDYPSLTLAGGAFEAINNAVVTGHITLQIAGDLTGENGTIKLNEFASPYTVTIKPTGVARSITGTSANSIIGLNGADRVTIDGSLGSTVNTVCPLVSATRDLTITNTNTGITSAVVWLNTNGANGATNNTVMNCNLVGNSNTTTLFAVGSGSSTIGTTSLGTGNNNNSFVNNNISKTQYGIYSQGASTANKNTGNVINQNLVNTVSPNNVRRAGVFVGFENNITISGNNISEIASATATEDVFGITFGTNAISTSTFTGNEVTNATVTKNIIGSIRHTNTYSACGIFVAPATSGTNLIANNMLSGVSANGTSGDFTVGILIGGGAGSTTQVYYNTVSMSGTQAGGSDKSYALAIGGSNPTVDIRNNILVNTQNNGTGINYAIGYGYSTFTNLTSDHNNYYVAAGGTYSIGATGSISVPTSQPTVLNLQTATGKDGFAQNVLPTFTSATNLHLVTPDANNFNLESAGVAVSVTDDIDCQSRPSGGPATAPDIGAHEFAGAVPACPGPGTPVMSAITTTSAIATWSGAGSYILEYGPPGYTPGSGGSAGAGGTLIDPAVSPQSITGLTPSTTYDLYVRTVCAGPSWSANTTVVTFTTLTPPPPNDLCSGATVIPCGGSISGNTTSATDDPLPGITCGSITPTTGNNRGVWFTVTPAFSGSLTINTCTGTTWDTYIRVYEGTCGSFTACAGFDDDGCSESTFGLSQLTFTAVGGTTYYILMGGFDPGEFGAYTISATCPPACAAPPQPTMSAIASTTATATWAGAGSFILEFGPTGYTPGTGGTAGAGGTLIDPAVSPQAISGLTASTTYDLYVRQVCAGPIWSANSPVRTFTTLAAPPANDEASGAFTLTVGAGCTGAPYTNVAATSGASEPYPSCSGVKQTPVWFKFVAPASGAVRISTDLGTAPGFTDSKVGLFSGTDAVGYTDFSIISCDDDGGSVIGSGFMSVVYATGLTPGTTYYIAVDKFSSGTTSGTFCIAVDELNTAMLSTTNTCASSYQSPGGSVSTYTGWVPLLDASSKLVALVRNPAGGNVSSYTTGQNIHTGPVRNAGGVYYLNRNTRIANSSATNVQVQFFFLTSELTALTAADPSVTLATLAANRQTETVSGCYNNFSTTNGTTTQLTQTVNGTSTDGLVKWIQVLTPGFSNFYLGGPNQVLPAGLLSFSGYKDGSRNQLRWITSSEQNNSGFEVQRSTDGINYTALGFVNSQALGGNSTDQLNYAYTDNSPSGSKQYYRLRQVNFDGNSKLSNVVLIKGEKPVSLTIDGLFPNPASTLVNVLIATPAKDKVTLVVTDIAGRTMLQKVVGVETGSNTIPVDISNLTSGTYMVKLICSTYCEGVVGKFVKQ